MEWGPKEENTLFWYSSPVNIKILVFHSIEPFYIYFFHRHQTQVFSSRKSICLDLSDFFHILNLTWIIEGEFQTCGLKEKIGEMNVADFINNPIDGDKILNKYGR